MGLPPPEGTIDARMVDVGTTFVIPFDRQLLPLTTHVELPQNVVEDLKQTQLRCRATATDRKVRQDKLLKLRRSHLRGNRLPTLASSHSAPPESWTLPGWLVPAENLGPSPLLAKFSHLEKPTYRCN